MSGGTWGTVAGDEQLVKDHCQAISIFHLRIKLWVFVLSQNSTPQLMLAHDCSEDTFRSEKHIGTGNIYCLFSGAVSRLTLLSDSALSRAHKISRLSLDSGPHRAVKVELVLS